MSFSVLSLFLSALATTIMAQTSVTSASGSSASGYPTADNFTACPSSVDSLCTYQGQTTFCYDATSLLYTITCGMSFQGTVMEANSAADEGEADVAKRDYFSSPYVTLADCQSACDSRATCEAVNVLDGASCQIMDTITGINTSAPGVVAAYKGYWGYNTTILGAYNDTNSTAYNLTLPMDLNSTSSESPNSTEPSSSDGTTSDNTTPTDISPEDTSVSSDDTSDASDDISDSEDDDSEASDDSSDPSDTADSTISDEASGDSSDPANTSDDNVPLATVNATYAAINVTSASVDSDTAPTTTNPAYVPSGVSATLGFGFTTVMPLGAAGTGLATDASLTTPPQDFPAPSAFPACNSVQCSLLGTPSTPFCHDPTVHLYTINCGLIFQGQTMLTIPNWQADLDNCADTCDIVENCQAVNFNTANFSCTLVTGVTGIDFAPQFIGAWQGYWAQQTYGGASSGVAPTGTAPSPSYGTSGPTISSANATTNATITSTTASQSANASAESFSALVSGSATVSSNATATITTAPIRTGATNIVCPSLDGDNYSNDGNTTYVINCDQTYEIDGIVLDTLSILKKRSDAVTSCMASCDSNAQCVALTVAGIECTLFSSVVGLVGNVGSTSALKVVSLALNTTVSSESTSATSTVSSAPSIMANSTVLSRPTGGISPLTNNTVPFCAETSCLNSTGVPNYCTDSANQLYTVNCGMYFQGTVASVANVSLSLDACLAYCDSVPQCLAVNWDGTQCSAVSVVTGIGYSANWTGAWVGYWATPTQAPVNSSSANSTIPRPMVTAVSAYPTQSADNGTMPSATGIEASVSPSPSANSTMSTISTSSSPLSTGSTSPSSNTSSLCSADCSLETCTDQSGQLYTLTCGSAYTGTFIITASKRDSSSPSLLDCEATCGGMDDCIALNYNTQCSYLSAVTGIEDVAGSVAVYKGKAPLVSTTTGSALITSSTATTSTSTASSPTNGTSIENATSVATPTSSGSNNTSGSAKPTGAFNPPVNQSSICSATDCVATFQQGFCEDESGFVYTSTCGIAFTGSILLNQTASTMNKCQTICDESNSCVAMNYAFGLCVYLSSVTGVEQVNNSLALWKGLWYGAAPSNDSAGNRTTGDFMPPESPSSTAPATVAKVDTTSSSTLGDSTSSANQTALVYTGTATVSSSTSTDSATSSTSTASASAAPTSNATCSSVSCVTPYQQSFCQDDWNTTYTITCGTAFEGTLLPGLSVGRRDTLSLSDCQIACDVQKSCVALNYDGTDCVYLSSVSGLEQRNGSVAAWKGLWVGGAPGNQSSYNNDTVTVLPFPPNVTLPSGDFAVLSVNITAIPTAPTKTNSSSSTVSSLLTTSTSTAGNSSSSTSNSTASSCASLACIAPYQQTLCQDSNNITYNVTCGVSLLGTFITTGLVRRGSSLLDCETTCDIYDDCAGLNFDGTSCALLSSITGTEEDAGSVAAIKSSSSPSPSTSSTTSSITAATATAATSAALPSSSAGPTGTDSSSSSSAGPGSVSSSATSTSSSSAPLTTGNAGYTAAANSSFSAPSCDVPAVTTCAAGQGLGASTFCNDARNRTFTVTCGIAFVGETTSNTVAPSLSECEGQCNSAAGCVAVNFANGTSCSLLDSISSVADAPGSFAAYLGLWIGAAPSSNYTSNYTTGGNETYGGGNYSFPVIPGRNSTIDPNVPAGNASDPTASQSPSTNSSDLSTTVSTASSSLAAAFSDSLSPSQTETVPAASSPTSASSTTSSPTAGATQTGSVASNASYPLCSSDCSTSNGTSYCSSNLGTTYSVNCGFAYSGTVVSQAISKRQSAASSLLDCETACDAGQSDCVALNFAHSTCTLFSTITEISSADGSIAAYKGYSSGNNAVNSTSGGNGTDSSASTNSVSNVASITAILPSQSVISASVQSSSNASPSAGSSVSTILSSTRSSSSTITSSATSSRVSSGSGTQGSTASSSRTSTASSSRLSSASSSRWPSSSWSSRTSSSTALTNSRATSTSSRISTTTSSQKSSSSATATGSSSKTTTSSASRSPSGNLSSTASRTTSASVLPSSTLGGSSGQTILSPASSSGLSSPQSSSADPGVSSMTAGTATSTATSGTTSSRTMSNTGSASSATITSATKPSSATTLTTSTRSRTTTQVKQATSTAQPVDSATMISQWMKWIQLEWNIAEEKVKEGIYPKPPSMNAKYTSKLGHPLV
ncbi:hypothetical protein BAUCODRAFT_128395 [Baudoinia panamericana UAMH 10762]|uniref:Apple domain-containing protein n=1 Tax=Baudoinia panamericana (strain UAMH 10762) TaxID=717646 RepID=M2MRY7_BAUPA|nr:uncharacterized protein BAUCODRAFT_128395 [Baudoinia panamericana UAMH 10762]EMC99601.1 hypothetical protein BAUCODRAFT_128395 [Baudoinia panamericana UAMH 10762]